MKIKALFHSFATAASGAVSTHALDRWQSRAVVRLLIMTLFASACGNGWGQPPSSPWAHTINNGQVTITRYMAAENHVVVPDTLSGFPVTRLAPGAFQFASFRLRSLTLPASITNINEGDFSFMRNLTNVTFLGNITSIPTAAFQYCQQLVSVNYPDTLTSIGDSAFSNCSQLADISLPEGLTRIGEWAFFGCSSLTKVTIPAKVTQIGGRAFSNCSQLEGIEVDARNSSYVSVDGVLYNTARTLLHQYPGARAGEFIVPETVTTLGPRAFDGCTKLTRVDLPAEITDIPAGTFARCSSLANLQLPPSVRTIGGQAFHYSGITNLSIPEGVTAIADETFVACDRLQSISLPESVRSIGHQGFAVCSSLRSFTLSKNVTSIGAGAFRDCTSLPGITVDDLNPSFASVDGVLFNKARTTLEVYPAGKTGAYQIPASVRSIAHVAFSGAAHLTTIDIPSTVTSMGTAAFQNCSQLTTVRVGKGVTTIPQAAFAGCQRLSKVFLSDGLHTLLESAFSGCAELRSISIPATVRNLELRGFDYLHSIYFEGNAPAAPQSSFNNGQITVYYREGTTGWRDTFADAPTRALKPRDSIIDKNPWMMRNGMFTLVGPPDAVLVVEVCADFSNPTWVPVSTNNLAQGEYSFVDPEHTNRRPTSFYRLRTP